jgi:hypothetical protein
MVQISAMSSEAGRRRRNGDLERTRWTIDLMVVSSFSKLS